jgi:hypothetical protein
MDLIGKILSAADIGGRYSGNTRRRNCNIICAFQQTVLSKKPMPIPSLKQFAVISVSFSELFWDYVWFCSLFSCSLLTLLVAPGQFKRMQSHMASHVDTARSEMFQESCDEVRNRLIDVCKQVEESMSIQTDEISRGCNETIQKWSQELKCLKDRWCLGKGGSWDPMLLKPFIEDFERGSADAQMAAKAARLASQDEKCDF